AVNQRHEGRPRRRPPWWPEGEPWPPSGRHGFRPPPRFLWRLAIFFFVAVAGVAALGALGIFAAMTAVGAVPAPHELRIVAGAAHEIRPPLSVIQGQAEAIVDGVHPGDAAHLAPILDATRLLERLVDDLRTLAQVESGALQIVHEPVDVARLVEETVAGFGAQASSAGVELRTELGGGADSLTGDPARLQGVLGNLVANAIRHTPAGGSGKAAAHRSGDRVTLEVADDGEG